MKLLDRHYAIIEEARRVSEVERCVMHVTAVCAMLNGHVDVIALYGSTFFSGEATVVSFENGIEI